MSTFGKTLAFLNMLAAVTFLCLAIILWGERDKWQYHVFQAELAIHGLPLTEVDPWPLPDNVIERNVEDEGRNTLKELFEPVGGNPVRSQRQEVEDQRDLVVQEIEQKKDEGEQRKQIKALLQRLARTGEERDAAGERADKAKVADLIADVKNRFDTALYLSNRELSEWLYNPQPPPKQPTPGAPPYHPGEIRRIQALDEDARNEARQALLDELVTLELPGMADFQQQVQANPGDLEQLENKIQNELLKKLTPPDAPSRKLREPDNRRQEIAHLLYNLSADPKWRQRVQVVVGLEAYNFAVDKQAAALGDMILRMQRLMDTDRSSFESKYRYVLQRRTFFLAQQVQLMEVALEDQKALHKKHKDLVAAREAEIAEFKLRTEKLKADAAVALGKQAEREQELFKEYREMAKTYDYNLYLERQIRLRELGK